MKKLNLLLIAVLCFASYGFGQRDWRKYSETYPETHIGIVTCLKADNDDFNILNEHNFTSPDYLVNKAAMENYERERSGKNSFRYTFSNEPAYFFVKNVNRTNAAGYEFQVTENDKVIVPWSGMDHFENPGFGVGDNASAEMAYLGGYKTNYGGKITVELREKSSTTILSKAVTQWMAIKPRINRVYTTDQLNEFLNDLTHEWINKNVKSPDLTKLKSTQNNLIFMLNATVTHKRQIEYQLEKDGKVYSKWRQNDFDNNFIWLKNLPHGRYQLRYRYSIQPEHEGSTGFEIKPAWYQTATTKIIMGSLSAAFLGLIVLVIILLKQRQKAGEEAEKQKRLQMELQTIRSQLNPHFVFNALTSIQGLVNKQDIDGANNYLTEFATLLRNTLANTEREQLPLVEEIKILETYLKLEQLRFNFSYQIQIADDINIYETDIPSLLLQPLIENSVKHGVANLKQSGKLMLEFKRTNDDLLVSVIDNGKGFDIELPTTGYGLKLVRKRIELLNNVVENRKILLAINSAPNTSTEIVLTFINWLA